MTSEQKSEIEIIALSVDGEEKIQMMIDRVVAEGGPVPDYTFVTDSNHAVIDRYGFFNAEERRGRPVPHPTTLVVDREGVIRWRFTEVDYHIRPTNEDILQALAELEN